MSYVTGIVRGVVIAKIGLVWVKVADAQSGYTLKVKVKSLMTVV